MKYSINNFVSISLITEMKETFFERRKLSKLIQKEKMTLMKQHSDTFYG